MLDFKLVFMKSLFKIDDKCYHQSNRYKLKCKVLQ